MTTGKKNALTAILAAIAIPVLSVTFATGAASRELAAKEDRAAHSSDVRDVLDSLRTERRVRERSAYRDSVRYDVLLDRVTEMSCEQNPRRRYCR